MMMRASLKPGEGHPNNQENNQEKNEENFGLRTERVLEVLLPGLPGSGEVEQQRKRGNNQKELLEKDEDPERERRPLFQGGVSRNVEVVGSGRSGAGRRGPGRLVW